MVYALINDIWSSRLVPYMVFCCSIVLWILIGSLSLPLMLNLLPLALFSFSFGNIFSTLVQRKTYSTNCINATICITAMLSVLFGAVLNRRISYTGATFGNLFYCFVAALSGSVLFTVLFKNHEIIGTNRFLCLLGRNSMTIVVMQYWFFRLFQVVGKNFFGISVWHSRSMLKALVVSIVTISLILTCVEMVKKVSNKNEKVLYVSKLFGFR